ncbi:hypothetical protein FSARC_12279 [Fusarium sarcochroum]|uniref:2EXR domain-containing protein n=1 Tax=Fusarium sarcochroum TaxID=1208366 RepID=A0A8H4TA09_9HYPO|nr:hypothetical protein FSARC_12279 [Fusarium sarcochroum]
METPAPSLSSVSRAYNVVTSSFQSLQSSLPKEKLVWDQDISIIKGQLKVRLNAEVGPSKADEDFDTRPATTFHKFKELPVELRVTIWNLSMREPRVFRLKRPPGNMTMEWVPFVFVHKPPPSTQACRESRAVSQVNGYQLFGLLNSVYKSLWFSPPTDIFYWDYGVFRSGMFDYYNVDLTGIKHVALEWPEDDEYYLQERLSGVCRMFPNCERLVFVRKHKPLHDTDVRLTYVTDNDDGWIGCLGEFWTRESLRGRIRSLCPESSFKKWVRIELAEIAPVRDGTGEI